MSKRTRKNDGNGTGGIVDRSEAERFLQLLDPSATFYTFQTFSDAKDGALVRVLHGTLAQHWGTLVRLNEQGAGIYVTVNETDGHGRKAENIVRVRALFIDLDGAPIPACVAPHIIVETSPGHWHLYWRVVGVMLDQFSDKQRALIALCGSDPAVCDLPRVMRVPGFLHRKGKPVLVRIISAHTRAPYTADAFPAVEAVQPRRPNVTLSADENRVACAFAFIPNQDLDWKAWCDLGLALFGATSGSAMGRAIFDAWSQRSAKYNARYTKTTWAGFGRSPPSRIGAGTIFFKASEAWPRWGELLDDEDPEASAVVAAFIATMGW